MINKNKSYLENVDRMIDECRHRMDKLITAREVIAEIAGKVTENVAPAVQPEQAITIRRVEGAPVEKKPAPRKTDPDQKQRRIAMRREILIMARNGTVITAGLLFKQFGLEDAPKSRKQDVYQVLYDLKVDNKLVKEHGTNRYHFPAPLPQPEPIGENKWATQPDAPIAE